MSIFSTYGIRQITDLAGDEHHLLQCLQRYMLMYTCSIEGVKYNCSVEDAKYICSFNGMLLFVDDSSNPGVLTAFNFSLVKCIFSSVSSNFSCFSI